MSGTCNICYRMSGLLLFYLVLFCIFKLAWYHFLIIVETIVASLVDISVCWFFIFRDGFSDNISLHLQLFPLFPLSSLFYFSFSCHFSNFSFFRLLLYCMCASRTTCHRWEYRPTCTKRPRYPRCLVINSHVLPSFPV